jgi:FtsZ-interacting cell division protein ZipA
MIFNIANLVNDGAISMDDLEEFSDDLKAAVRIFLRKG